MCQTSLTVIAGSWIINKLRRQQIASGTYQAARNAWRQGIPLAVALAALTGRDRASK